jgi:hypothetical protein
MALNRPHAASAVGPQLPPHIRAAVLALVEASQ